MKKTTFTAIVSVCIISFASVTPALDADGNLTMGDLFTDMPSMEMPSMPEMTSQTSGTQTAGTNTSGSDIFGGSGKMQIPDFSEVDAASWFQDAANNSPFSLSMTIDNSALSNATLQGADAFLSQAMGSAYVNMSTSMSPSVNLSGGTDQIDFTNLNMDFATMKAVVGGLSNNVGTSLDSYSLKDWKVSDAKDVFFQNYAEEVKNFGAKPYSIPSSFNPDAMLQLGQNAQNNLKTNVTSAIPNYNTINNLLSGGDMQKIFNSEGKDYFDQGVGFSDQDIKTLTNNFDTAYGESKKRADKKRITYNFNYNMQNKRDKETLRLLKKAKTNSLENKYKEKSTLLSDVRDIDSSGKHGIIPVSETKINNKDYIDISTLDTDSKNLIDGLAQIKQTKNGTYYSDIDMGNDFKVSNNGTAYISRDFVNTERTAVGLDILR